MSDESNVILMGLSLFFYDIIRLNRVLRYTYGPELSRYVILLVALLINLPMLILVVLMVFFKYEQICLIMVVVVWKIMGHILTGGNKPMD